MIRATNQLTEKERKDAKNIDCQLPSLGPNLSENLISPICLISISTRQPFSFIIKMEVACYQNGGCLVY